MALARKKRKATTQQILNALITRADEDAFREEVRANLQKRTDEHGVGLERYRHDLPVRPLPLRTV